jgi:cyanoexosortase A
MVFTNIRFQKDQFWLLAIAVGCIAIQLTLAWRSNNSNLLCISFLFWVAVSSLIWERRNQLDLESGVFSSLFALTILVLVFIKILPMNSLGYSLFVLPSLLSFCVALLASGFKGLKQYKKELFLLTSFSIINIVPTLPIKISIFTAKLSAFVLWYLGYEVKRVGVYIHLPTGSIEVASGCSGMNLICYLLSITILFLIMSPIKRRQTFIVPIVTILIAFIVNGLRVALMAVVIANKQMEAFEYWHHGDGSLIFSLIAVSLFALFYWYLISLSDKSKYQKIQSN